MNFKPRRLTTDRHINREVVVKKTDRIARELELSVSSAVENAKDRVEAAG